jgi:hypothetical protein
MSTDLDRDVYRHAVADVVELVMECCADRGWSLDVNGPGLSTSDHQYVARIRNREQQSLGLGMAAESPAAAIVAAFRSAWVITYGTAIDDIAGHLY